MAGCLPCVGISVVYHFAVAYSAASFALCSQRLLNAGVCFCFKSLACVEFAGAFCFWRGALLMNDCLCHYKLLTARGVVATVCLL